MKHFKIATASINTIALDINHNKSLIEKSIKHAEKMSVDILLLPELCLSGYGAEDMFLSNDFIESCWQALSKLHKTIACDSILVAVGLPYLDDDGKLYNACVLLTKNKILGVVCKQFLAKSGVHYEPRWFEPWPQGQKKNIYIDEAIVPVGELIFDINGFKIGFEICEDAWATPRLGQHLSQIGLDILLNPSASHFAIDKHQKRYQLVMQGSKDFDCVYVYSNLLGCEAGRTIYDGGNMVASKGKLLLQGKRFAFNSLYIDTVNLELEPKLTKTPTNIYIVSHKIKSFGNKEHLNLTNAIEYQPENLLNVVILALSLGLWDWQNKTSQRGYVISLSGGADSALCASAVYLAHCTAFIELGSKSYHEALSKLNITIDMNVTNISAVKEKVMPQVLTTVYQSSVNSGKITRQAAKILATGLGASHHCWSIESEVESYQDKIEQVLKRKLNWQQDDIALQNIQARVRSPGIWLIANIESKLLLATSNLSEASVGYCTMDGDTSGVLAPIGGISKSLVLQLNNFLCDEGIMILGQRIKIPELIAINKQKPTAELRPIQQSDETDLMPFEVLDKIRYLSQVKHLAPNSVQNILLQTKFKVVYESKNIKQFIKKYYKLYSKNQWKRERLAVSFHIEHDSACPKTFRRFPVLNNINF